MENHVETIKYTPEKAKQNALAKLDLIRKWQEFRRKAVNKLQADYDFVKLHNSSDSYLFTVLGKISRGSLHRWKSMLDGTEDGLYAKLGIETVFARPYNARSKVIERFFKEFQEGFEKLMPSYVGSSIINKPAYLKRNENFHKNLHQDYIPTIEETIKMIDMWLKFKNSQLCTNAPNMTIAEVLESRKKQNIDINTLDDLMMATEVKTIQRNGVRFLNCDYFNERLYGLRGKVLVKYNLVDQNGIYKYNEETKTGENYEIFSPQKNKHLKISIEDAKDYFMKNYVKKYCKFETYRNYNAIFNFNIIPFINCYYLHEIDIESIKELFKVCELRRLKPRRIKNTMALLNQLIKYFQHLGVIDRSCVYQVKKVQDKNHFGIENLILRAFNEQNEII